MVSSSGADAIASAAGNDGADTTKASVGLFASDVMLVDFFLDAVERDGMFGTTGTIGPLLVAGLDSAFEFELDDVRGGPCGVTTDEGVVGCVESASEGACDVVGVAEVDGKGSGCRLPEDMWLVGVGVVLTSGVSVSVGVFILGGSSTGRFDDWGAGRRRRLLELFGGKSASDTEYQGSCSTVSKGKDSHKMRE